MKICGIKNIFVALKIITGLGNQNKIEKCIDVSKSEK